LPILDYGKNLMHNTFRIRFGFSRSDNRISKIQNRKWMGIVALIIAFEVCGAVATAQQPRKVHRIGYLSQLDLAGESTRSEPIRLALRELGYIEGQNIAIEYRYADGKLDRLPELAAELVRLKVDVIVTGGDIPVRAVKNATKTIPIVMSGRGSILSRQVSLKASPVPAATSPALQTLREN